MYECVYSVSLLQQLRNRRQLGQAASEVVRLRFQLVNSPLQVVPLAHQPLALDVLRADFNSTYS